MITKNPKNSKKNKNHYSASRETNCFEKKHYLKNGNSNEAENNDSQNDTNASNRDELFSQLNTLNLSIDTLYIIILATFLNLYYLYSLKAEVSDQLFNTNESEKFVDTKDFPRITNAMFLYSTGIFLDVNYKGLEEARIASRQSNDKRGLIRALKSFLSSLLIFIATIINRDNLEL